MQRGTISQAFQLHVRCTTTLKYSKAMLKIRGVRFKEFDMTYCTIPHIFHNIALYSSFAYSTRRPQPVMYLCAL